MADAGALLATFHRGRATSTKVVTPKGEREELRAASGLIATAFPALKPRLKQWVRAWKLLRRKPEVTSALLHGSFRLNHLMIEDERLAMIDLDSLRVGPPSYDIANWIASLYYLEAQGRIGAAQRVAIARGFLDGYARHAAWEIPPAEVMWFLAGLLIHKQARKYATRFHAGREEKVERMLMHADEILVRVRRLPATDLAGMWSLLP